MPCFSGLARSKQPAMMAKVTTADPALKDYSSEAAGLLNQIRTPAALLAGVTFGALFGMPLNTTDPMQLALLKRIYMVVLALALHSNLLAVVGSTVGLCKLTQGGSQVRYEYASPTDLLKSEVEMEWISSIFHFLLGLTLFAGAISMRAGISISCPATRDIIVLFSVASLCHMMSIFNSDMYSLTGSPNLLQLGFFYARLVMNSWSTCWLNAASSLFSLGGLYATLRLLVHIYHFKPTLA